MDALERRLRRELATMRDESAAEEEALLREIEATREEPDEADAPMAQILAEERAERPGLLRRRVRGLRRRATPRRVPRGEDGSGPSQARGGHGRRARSAQRSRRRRDAAADAAAADAAADAATRANRRRERETPKL